MIMRISSLDDDGPVVSADLRKVDMDKIRERSPLYKLLKTLRAHHVSEHVSDKPKTLEVALDKMTSEDSEEADKPTSHDASSTHAPLTDETKVEVEASKSATASPKSRRSVSTESHVPLPSPSYLVQNGIVPVPQVALSDLQQTFDPAENQSNINEELVANLRRSTRQRTKKSPLIADIAGLDFNEETYKQRLLSSAELEARSTRSPSFPNHSEEKVVQGVQTPGQSLITRMRDEMEWQQRKVSMRTATTASIEPEDFPPAAQPVLAIRTMFEHPKEQSSVTSTSPKDDRPRSPLSARRVVFEPSASKVHATSTETERARSRPSSGKNSRRNTATENVLKEGDKAVEEVVISTLQGEHQHVKEDLNANLTDEAMELVRQSSPVSMRRTSYEQTVLESTATKVLSAKPDFVIESPVAEKLAMFQEKQQDTITIVSKAPEVVLDVPLSEKLAAFEQKEEEWAVTSVVSDIPPIEEPVAAKLAKFEEKEQQLQEELQYQHIPRHLQSEQDSRSVASSPKSLRRPRSGSSPKPPRNMDDLIDEDSVQQQNATVTSPDMRAVAPSESVEPPPTTARVKRPSVEQIKNTLISQEPVAAPSTILESDSKAFVAPRKSSVSQAKSKLEQSAAKSAAAVEAVKVKPVEIRTRRVSVKEAQAMFEKAAAEAAADAVLEDNVPLAAGTGRKSVVSKMAKMFQVKPAKGAAGNFVVQKSPEMSNALSKVRAMPLGTLESGEELALNGSNDMTSKLSGADLHTTTNPLSVKHGKVSTPAINVSESN